MEDIIGTQRIKRRRSQRSIVPVQGKKARRLLLDSLKDRNSDRLRHPKRKDASVSTQRRVSLAITRQGVRSVLLVIGASIALLGILVTGTILYARSPFPSNRSLAALVSPASSPSAPGDASFAATLYAYALKGDAVAQQDGGDALPFTIADTFLVTQYTVRPGDTISGIAARYGLRMDSLIGMNDIQNVKSLRSGAVLRIPNMDGIPYKVVKGDSLSSICSRWNVPLEAVLDANSLESSVLYPGTSLFLPGAKLRENDLKRALGKLFLYPVRGTLTSTFGWRADPFTGARRFHGGIDLANSTGTTITAAMSGRVSMVGYNSLYGRFVILTHDDGFQTWYAHLSKATVSKGDRIAQGQKVGELGNTGYSTGPHLHFAIYKNGKSVDPLLYLSR